MILFRFAGVCSRASLIAASFASAPELQKNALPPKLRSRQQLGPSTLSFRMPRIGHVNQLGRLLLNRFHNPRRTMAQQVAAPTGKEVQILPALVVPHQRAFAAHEAHREPSVIRHHVLGEKLRRFGIHGLFLGFSQ